MENIIFKLLKTGDKGVSNKIFTQRNKNKSNSRFLIMYNMNEKTMEQQLQRTERKKCQSGILHWATAFLKTKVK
jgi:hypothetical protein